MSNGYSAGFPLGAYPGRFHPEAAPLWIASILAARGVRPPATEGTTWCEIGCGQGFDSLILAATNPGMQFWGIDADPGHIATATAMAKAAGIGNARFLCADIRDGSLLADLPDEVDFLVLHGIWSWVSPGIRDALLRFAAKRLRPGGALLIQYMSQPGAALFLALQGLMASLGGGVAERIATLRAMAAAGAGFFVQYPHASAVLDRLAQEDPALVAHEYLGAGVSAFTAYEMIAAFAGCGLSYIGSARPIENYDSVSLPAGIAPLLAAEPDAARRETLRDTARNQHLRYDLCQRAPQLMTPGARWEAARGRRYLARPGLPAARAVTFRSAIGPVEGPTEIFGPILARLARGATGFADLAQALDGQAGMAEQALMMLMGAGMVHPMRPETAPAAPAAGRLAALLSQDQTPAALHPDARIGSAWPIRSNG